jgi:uncharacterized protein (DUF4415 family)
VVSFQRATLVFGDPGAISLLDDYELEERWLTVGLVNGVVVLVVVHTLQEPAIKMRMKTKMKKKSESFQREKPRAVKEKSMNGGAKAPDPELEALLRLRDEDMDTSDIPEITDWSKAVVGKFCRPIKSPVTIRLDADVLAWLKHSGSGYQTRINALLRQAMHRRRPASHSAANSRPKKSR